MNNISVSNKFINKMMEVADQNNIHYEVFEGSLNDNYIFYSDNKIKIPYVRRTKYIIIEEKYLNTWSSDLVLIATDNKKKVENFENKFYQCLL